MAERAELSRKLTHIATGWRHMRETETFNRDRVWCKTFLRRLSHLPCVPLARSSAVVAVDYGLLQEAESRHREHLRRGECIQETAPAGTSTVSYCILRVCARIMSAVRRRPAACVASARGCEAAWVGGGGRWRSFRDVRSVKHGRPSTARKPCTSVIRRFTCLTTSNCPIAPACTPADMMRPATEQLCRPQTAGAGGGQEGCRAAPPCRRQDVSDYNITCRIVGPR